MPPRPDRQVLTALEALLAQQQASLVQQQAALAAQQAALAQETVRREEESRASLLEKFRKLEPPIFRGGARPTEAHQWLLGVTRTLDTMGVPEERRVSLAAYQFEGAALTWWQLEEQSRAPGAAPLSWEAFREGFLQQYFPPSVRSAMCQDFINLKQGSRSVTEYQVQFEELARYAPSIVGTDLGKAERFEQGLDLQIRGGVVSQIPTSYLDVVERAKRYERHVVDSARVLGKRSHPGEGSRQPPHRRPSPGGQPQRQQRQVTCFECGAVGHVRTACPRLRNQRPRPPQYHRGGNPPARPAPAAPPPGGHPPALPAPRVLPALPAPRAPFALPAPGAPPAQGCYRCGRLGHRIAQCPQPAPARHQRGGRNRGQARAQAIIARDPAAEGTIIRGTLPVFGLLCDVVIDSGSTHSYIGPHIVAQIGPRVKPLKHRLSVISPLGKSLSVDQVCENSLIVIGDRELSADLIVLHLDEIDILLGMDWLSAYHATMDCFRKRVIEGVSS